MKKNKREEIMRIALELMRESGSADVSIQAICDACSITKSTFYYYFDSKEDVFSHVFTIFDENISQIYPALLRCPNATHQFFMLVNRYTRCVEELGVTVMRQMVNYDMEHKGHAVFPLANAGTNSIIVIIEVMQEDGMLGSWVDGVAFWNTLNRLYAGVLLEWCIDDGSFSLFDACLEEALRLLQIPEDDFEVYRNL